MFSAENTHVATNPGILNADVAFLGSDPTQWVGFYFEAVERNLGELPSEQPADEGAPEVASLLQSIWEEPGSLAKARPRFEALAREVLEHPTRESRAAVAFERLIRWCCTNHHRHGRKTAFRRFCALSATVDPRLVSGKTYADIARALRVTKASVSANARDFRKAFSFYFHEWRCREGREHMRQARLAQRLPGAAKAIARHGHVIDGRPAP
jgi:hypothetical protein